MAENQPFSLGGEMSKREIIAKRIAKEFQNGMFVNLGIGIPTLSANFVPPDVNVILQTENGGLKFGGKPSKDLAHPDLANAGGEPISLLSGASVFDLSMSFVIIRGGHLDATVLGALQVDELGQVANWSIPGIKTVGMGGGMDLLSGAKKVIIAMQHLDKNGNPKIVKKCSLPLSSIRKVNLIITDMAVIEVNKDGLVLIEIAPETTIDEVVAKTQAELIIPKEVTFMY